MDSSENVHHMTGLEKIKFLGRFIAKVILYVIIVLFSLVYALCCIYFGNMLHNMHKNENRPTLFNTYVIVSGSMVPNINIQDGVVIKREEMKDLKQGDIITFVTHDPRYDGYIITHRIIAKEKTNGNYYFRTKGDANSVEDSYLVTKDDIYGRVFLKIPKIGYLKTFLSNTMGWLILVIIPSLIIVVYDVLKLVRHVNKKPVKEEKEELEII
ncbi:MAG: signal peptidase I [Bacilli bacterium]|nr:signal peptidase I [Bacilli bacterium]